MIICSSMHTNKMSKSPLVKVRELLTYIRSAGAETSQAAAAQQKPASKSSIEHANKQCTSTQLVTAQQVGSAPDQSRPAKKRGKPGRAAVAQEQQFQPISKVIEHLENRGNSTQVTVGQQGPSAPSYCKNKCTLTPLKLPSFNNMHGHSLKSTPTVSRSKAP